MKVLSTERLGFRKIGYWIEDNGQYIEQIISDDNSIEEWSSVPVSKYKSYKNFAEIMGKFCPYTVFMLKPITIKKLDFESVLAVVNQFEKLQTDAIKKGNTNAG